MDTEAVAQGQVLYEEAGLRAGLHVDNVSLLAKEGLISVSLTVAVSGLSTWKVCSKAASAGPSSPLAANLISRISLALA